MTLAQIVVTWPQLAALAAVLLSLPGVGWAALRVGDRLWGGNGGNGIASRMARLETKVEERSKHLERKIDEIREDIRGLRERM